MCRPLPQRFYLACALENLATFLVDGKRPNEARPVEEEALSIVRNHAGPVDLLRNLELCAHIAALEGQLADAARLIGSVNAAYGRVDGERNLWDARSYERLWALLKAGLSESDLSASLAEGARWDADQAVSFTFERIIRREAGQGA